MAKLYLVSETTFFQFHPSHQCYYKQLAIVLVAAAAASAFKIDPDAAAAIGFISSDQDSPALVSKLRQSFYTNLYHFGPFS